MNADRLTSPRRRVWVAAAAVGATAAAIGWWWRWRQDAADGNSPAQALWSLTVEMPQGQPLALSRFRGRPLLVNFWASWCPPCVKEMPLLDRFAREQAAAGWQVLGLAVDNAPAVRDFLAGRPVGFPIGILGGAGADLTRQLGDTGGGLPFSCVFDARGRQRFQHLGDVSPALLAQWVRELS